MMSGRTENNSGKRGGASLVGLILRRFLFVFLLIILLAASALVLVLNMVFTGPSPAARDMLTMALIEASATKWVPGIFLGDEAVEAIRKNVDAELPDEVTDTSQVVIQSGSIGAASDEWADHPDGVYFVEIQGQTFNAHLMVVRDPSKVYMATSTPGSFSRNIPGIRITEAIEKENGIAAVNRLA